MGIISLTLFMFFFGCVAGYALGVPAIVIKSGHALNLVALSKSIICSVPILLIVSFVFAVIISVLFPSYISPQGLHGHSFWGTRNFLAWTDITQVRPFKLGNLTYARLYSGSGQTTLWFPLFQSPQPYFSDEIRRFAPKDSPILNFLG